MFAGENLRMTQKNFTRWFNQKKAWSGVLKMDLRATAKPKIILC